MGGVNQNNIYSLPFFPQRFGKESIDGRVYIHAQNRSREKRFDFLVKTKKKEKLVKTIGICEKKKKSFIRASRFP